MNTATKNAISATIGDYVWTDDAQGLVTDVIINEGDTVTLILDNPRVSYPLSVTLGDAAPISLMDRFEFEATHSWDCPCSFCYVLYT